MHILNTSALGTLYQHMYVWLVYHSIAFYSLGSLLMYFTAVFIVMLCFVVLMYAITTGLMS